MNQICGPVTSHEEPWREGKSRYPLPLQSCQSTSLVPFGVEDAPDVDCCSQSATLETESLRLTSHVLDRVGFQFSVISLPTLPFPLTRCHVTTGSLCQAVRRFFPAGIAHHLWFPNPGKGKRKRQGRRPWGSIL